MCGLVGVFGDIFHKEENLFCDMLYVDVIRGPHSTGVCLVNYVNKEYQMPALIKGTLTPQDIFEEKEFKDAKAKKLALMMGHNRYATKGAISPENSHPFWWGDTILCHNGTITGQHRLPAYKEFETDSENIAYAVDTQGIKETWKSLDGAATLTWYNASNNTMNFISNGKRSFFYAYNKRNDCVIWASELWMIKSLAQRRDMDIGTIYKPKNNYHTVFSLDEKTKRLNMSYKELSPFVPTYRVGGYKTGSGKGGNNKNTVPVNEHNASIDDLYDYPWNKSNYIWDKDKNDWVDPYSSDKPAVMFHEGVKHIWDTELGMYIPEAEKEELDNNVVDIEGARKEAKEFEFDPSTLREKTITLKQWIERHKTCFFCEKDINNEKEYQRGLELSPYEASCGACADEAERIGLDLANNS